MDSSANDFITPHSGTWETFECAEIARYHSFAPNVTKLEFLTQRRTERKSKVTRKKVSKNLICLAVLGGCDGRTSDPTRISARSDEYITLLPLGSADPTDLKDGEVDQMTSTLTFLEMKMILKKYQNPLSDFFVLASATKLSYCREHLIISGALPVDDDATIVPNIALPLGGAVFESVNESKTKTLSVLGG